MSEGYCFFIGHRDAGEKNYTRLRNEIERLILDRGITHFVVGHYGCFDALAARAVLEIKQQHPQVMLLDLLPYHPGQQRRSLPEGFDGSVYPEGQESVPRRFAIVKANRYAVKHCSILLACVYHPASNAAGIMNYAIKRGIPVINIGE